MKRLAIALVVAGLAPAAALAETQQERDACTPDAFSVCAHAIPDRDRVATCLAQNINRLSPACHNVMARYQKPSAPPPRPRYSTGN